MSCIRNWLVGKVVPFPHPAWERKVVRRKEGKGALRPKISEELMATDFKSERGQGLLVLLLLLGRRRVYWMNNLMQGE